MSTIDMPTETLQDDHPWATAEPSALWFVLRTRCNQEKKVAEMLAANASSHFLPLAKEIRYRGTQKTTMQSPMFRGYVFLKGQREDAYPAERNKRIVQILPVLDQDQLEWELLNIHKALKAESMLQPHRYGLNVGTPVEVHSGPFKGLQGRVESLGNSARLILCVSMLNRAMSLEIDGSLLTRLD